MEVALLGLNVVVYVISKPGQVASHALWFLHQRTEYCYLNHCFTEANNPVGEIVLLCLFLRERLHQKFRQLGLIEGDARGIMDVLLGVDKLREKYLA